MHARHLGQPFGLCSRSPRAQHGWHRGHVATKSWPPALCSPTPICKLSNTPTRNLSTRRRARCPNQDKSSCYLSVNHRSPAQQPLITRHYLKPYPVIENMEILNQLCTKTTIAKYHVYSFWRRLLLNALPHYLKPYLFHF